MKEQVYGNTQMTDYGWDYSYILALNHEFGNKNIHDKYTW